MADRLINKWKKIVLLKTSQQPNKEDKDSEKKQTTQDRGKTERKENNKATTPCQGNQIFLCYNFK